MPTRRPSTRLTSASSSAPAAPASTTAISGANIWGAAGPEGAFQYVFGVFQGLQSSSELRTEPERQPALRRAHRLQLPQRREEPGLLHQRHVLRRRRRHPHPRRRAAVPGRRQRLEANKGDFTGAQPRPAVREADLGRRGRHLRRRVQALRLRLLVGGVHRRDRRLPDVRRRFVLAGRPVHFAADRRHRQVPAVRPLHRRLPERQQQPRRVRDRPQLHHRRPQRAHLALLPVRRHRDEGPELRARRDRATTSAPSSWASSSRSDAGSNQEPTTTTKGRPNENATAHSAASRGDDRRMDAARRPRPRPRTRSRSASSTRSRARWRSARRR